MLTGGRGIPDMLVVKYLKPDIIFNLTTETGRGNAENLKKLVEEKFHCTMEILPPIRLSSETGVEAEQEIKEACIQALQREPEAEWTIHFTSAPKIVGIYAHDVARDHKIPYLFLETSGKKVVSMVTASQVNCDTLFEASVEEYMNAYGRVHEETKSDEYRELAESLFPVAQILIQDSVATQLLLQEVRRGSREQEEQKDAKLLEISVDRQTEGLIKQLHTYGIFTDVKQTIQGLHCTIADFDKREFLKGDWLEVYIYAKAKEADFADDCQWGYKITAKLPSNELDLALTYNAQLLVAECKSGRKPFQVEYLYKLHSIADLVGNNYVQLIFITSIPRPKENDLYNFEMFNNFCQQADVRRIRVVTGDELPQIGSILRDVMRVDKIDTPVRHGVH